MNYLINPEEGSERPLATAAFASERSIAGLGYKEGDFWLGRAADSRPLGIRDDRHILLVAGSRSGKGRTTIIPTLINWPGSAVVIDPKGENATLTAARRGKGSRHAKGMGQRVYVLDPFHEVRNLDEGARATFNPLDVLDPSENESVDEAARLAAAIVVPNPEAKDPYFDDQARYLVRSIILHVVSSPNYEGRRNLTTVRQLLLAGDLEAFTALDQGDDPDPVSAFDLLFEDMKRNAHFRGVVSTAGAAFANLYGGDGWRSISSTAISHTNFIDSPDMQDSLKETTPGFKLSDLKTDPNGVTVFISLPQRHMADHFRWLRMITTLVITEMEKTRGAPKTGHPVLMCLDEFAGLKRMEVIENAAAQIAGFGVKLFIVVQNLVQLKTVYKDNWETFIGNSGTKLFFGIDDNFTREYLSKQMGETEVLRTTSNESESKGTSYSESAGRSSSVSYSTGTNSSSSSSFSESSTYSPGPFWSTHVSSNFSSSFSSNSGSSSGRSTSQGTNSSTTQGTNESQSRGRSEGIHKRALLTPEEIGLLFSRQDEQDNPAYPGLALALLTGRAPIILRRTNYDQDELFAGLFDPHPDYPFLPKAKAPLTIDAKPNSDRELHRSLVEYYGPEKVEQAVRIFRKFVYEAPDTPILEDGPMVFAKTLLDRARENTRAVQKYGDRSTVDSFLDYVEGNVATLIKSVGNKKNLDDIWFGHDHGRKAAILTSQKQKGTLGLWGEFQLYGMTVKNPWFKFIGLIVAVAVLQRAFRGYLFAQGIRPMIGPTNVVILGTMVASIAIVFLAMNKISGSKWVAGAAVAGLFLVISAMNSAWPIT